MKSYNKEQLKYVISPICISADYIYTFNGLRHDPSTCVCVCVRVCVCVKVDMVWRADTLLRW